MRTALTLTPWVINFTFFFVGMALLWLETHNWWAMAYACLASLHFTFGIKTAPEAAPN